jgi:hypothetical protein
MIDLDAIQQAIEERNAALANLEDLAQRLEYHGNSVAWWHSKATNYGNALMSSWDALKAAGVPCDGQTTVADGICKLAANRDALRAAAGKVTCWECNGTGLIDDASCPDCADLRALLNPPGNPRSGPARG